MPKELIYPPEGPTADTRVEVGWSREKYVQIATTRLHKPQTQNIEAIEAVEHFNPLEPAGSTWDGWFMDLDRHQINDLIRVLRRARDQAFGRDE